MWLSSWGKFRKVLIFDAGKVCVSQRFSLIRRRKRKCSVESTRNNASNFPIPSNCTIGHFWVPKTLTFKMRPSAQPFLWKWVLFAWEWKIISISKAEHLTSFWYRGPGELGNGLFHVKEIVHPSFSKPWFRKVCWTILWLKWVMPYSSRQTLVHNMSLSEIRLHLLHMSFSLFIISSILEYDT